MSTSTIASAVNRTHSGNTARTTLTGRAGSDQIGPGDDGWPSADPLLAAMATLRPNDPRRAGLRDRVICQCAPAAQREAIRYRRTGEAWDDLVQVATVGLILAVDRYDPTRGIPFKHFALPTIGGELKRHFRDKRWSVRVSRRVQELCQEIRQAEPLLAQQLGRIPTEQDLAAHLRLPEEDVRAARAGQAAQTARSLDAPVFGDDDPGALQDYLGSNDQAIDALADRDALHRALPTLPERLRTIITLRFVDELSQTQIADKLGISQMHVSRLLSRSLAQLRRHMMAERPVGSPPGGVPSSRPRAA